MEPLPSSLMGCAKQSSNSRSTAKKSVRGFIIVCVVLVDKAVREGNKESKGRDVRGFYVDESIEQ